MNKAISLQKYLNNNQCVTLPNNRQGSTLELTNKYLGDYEIQEILKNLGIMSLIEENNKNIDNKLSSYVTLQFLLDNFVKKEDIYDGDEDEDYYFDGEDWSKSSDSSQVSVDDELSLTSTNPIQNRVVAQALSEIMTQEDIIQTLREFSGQTKLVAGYGIKIEGNVISSTLDVNPFVVVNSLPTTNINPNKIYLVHSQGDVYVEYKYIVDSQFMQICPDDSNGEWIRIGEISVGIDLSSLIPDDKFQPKGDYITTYQLNKLLKKYVKKSDVYTPKLWGDDEENDDEGGNGGSGGGSSDITPISITIDSFLSKNSVNPVANNVITIELEKKQDVLTAGEGITIENGIISSTFDTNLYEIVTALPLSGKSNKIYLLETLDGRYKEYIYQNNKWIFKGYRDFGIDITKYVKQSELQDYVKTSYLERYYATKEDIAELTPGSITSDEVQRLINSALEGIPEALETLTQLKELLEGDNNPLAQLQLLLASKANSTDVYTKNECDTLFQPKGNYVTSSTFNTYKELISSKLDIVGNYDESLSLTSINAVQNKVIARALQNKVSSDDLEDYLTIESFNLKIAEYNKKNNFKTINNNSIIGTGNISIKLDVDSELSDTSLKPVQNKIIYSALQQKVNTSQLQSLQNKLTAGFGIKIENDIISSTLDINPFVIIEELPEEGSESKLYLVKSEDTYKQYLYKDDNWTEIGSIDFNIDLTDYLKSSVAQQTYLTISSFNGSMQSLTSWINDNFVNKAKVYTPSQGENESDGAEEPYTPDVNPSSPTPSLGGSGFYESRIANGIKTNLSVGNINSGTNISLLKGKTFSELFDMLLFKEIWPNADARHTISMTTPSTIVKVGTLQQQPVVVAQWNQNILPINNIQYSIQEDFNPYVNYSLVQTASSYYDKVGVHTITLNYSYPSGKQTITSNYGNTKEVTISGNSGTITRTINVTCPWYVNDVEQSNLVPVNTQYNTTLVLNGTPSIAIPGDLSICSIKANLGLGFMDVDWNKTVINKDGIPYSVWTKPDYYSNNVEHQIQFVIMFDSNN